MKISFLQTPESDDLQDFEQWLKKKGFSLTQIASMGDVVNVAGSLDYLPCIASDGDGIPMVLVKYNGNIIVWSTLEDDLEEGFSDTHYWVAVNVSELSDEQVLEFDDDFTTHLDGHNERLYHPNDTEKSFWDL